jgi:Sulfotransferase family
MVSGDSSTRGSAPRGLFVVGAARSGTTLLGNYLGSSPCAFNLGEYGAFNLAYRLAPATIGRIPGPFRDAYLAALAVHSREFAQRSAAEVGRSWYCDSTPWNVFVANRIDADVPGSVFVLVLRHYAGTVQSLRRSHADGGRGGGATWPEAAAQWAACYGAVGNLPSERTVPVSYDTLVADPGRTLALLRSRLEEHGFDASELDLGQTAVSHATSPARKRPTMGREIDGKVELNPIRSFESEHWSGDLQNMIWPLVRDVHRDLKNRFPAIYTSPPPPRVLWFHDKIKGRVPARLQEW